MSLRVCRECNTVYAVGLPVCPQCGADDAFNRYEWEGPVPKVSANDGLVSNLLGPAEEASEPAATELTEPADTAEGVAVDLDAPSAEEQGDPEPPAVEDSTAPAEPGPVSDQRTEPLGDAEPAPDSAALANEYANEAKAAFEKGDYAEALSQLDLAAEFDPSREARWDSLRKRVSDAMQGSGWDG